MFDAEAFSLRHANFGAAHTRRPFEKYVRFSKAKRAERQGLSLTPQHASPPQKESAPPCSFAANHGDDMVRLYRHCRADALFK